MTDKESVEPVRVARDINTYDDFLRALNSALRRSPSLRVCQLIVNATGCDDPFYVEDDDLIRALDNYRGR